MSDSDRSFSPERLVKSRIEARLTQRALATAAGLSQSLVAELERGKHPPSRASLDKLAGALGVDPSEFLR